jgi:hypothetical protein
MSGGSVFLQSEMVEKRRANVRATVAFNVNVALAAWKGEDAGGVGRAVWCTCGIGGQVSSLCAVGNLQKKRTSQACLDKSLRYANPLHLETSIAIRSVETKVRLTEIERY